MISTRSLAALPDIERLKRLCQSIAMLDAILEPDWQNRYYSFNSQWPDRQMVATMRNGSGDEYFIGFNPYGAIIKGFDHEAQTSPYAHHPPTVWPGVLDTVPSEFTDYLEEPAFERDATTFCLWRRHSDRSWQTGAVTLPKGDDPDGSEHLLAMLDGKPETYGNWAENYHQRAVPLNLIRLIYQHEPLTPQMLKALNPKTSIEDVSFDVTEIGYPLATAYKRWLPTDGQAI